MIVTAPPPLAAPDPATAGSRAARSVWTRLPVLALVVLAAGVLTGLAWEPYGLWPLLLIGLPIFTVAVRSARPRRAFTLGYLYGFALLGISIGWIHVLGTWIAVALIAFESLFFGLLAIALMLVQRLRLWPIAAACCWVALEFTYSRVPFGGFGWTRLAYAAVDTPLSGFLPMIGVAGLTFVVALIGQLPARVLLAGRQATSAPIRRRTVPMLAGGLALALLLGGWGLGSYGLAVDPDQTTLQVGVVQGNVPGRGIEAMGRMRSVTNNHLAETVDLMARARLAGEKTPDFVLWPENSTDIDPLADVVTGRTVQSAAEIAGVPILVGAVMEGPGEDERQTSALWWDPKAGVLARYNKRNLVPFGEWIPFRKQLLPVVPILKEVGAQSVPGVEPGVLEVSLGATAGGDPGQTVRVGDIICFELAYDNTVADVITHGAQVVTVQSNNATYGGTGQIEQQFAITRARAMESRREIAVATTNSVSGYIDRDGTVLKRTDEFTNASLSIAMPLRSGLTPAMIIGPWVNRALALGALMAIAAAVIGSRTSRRARA